MNRIFKKHNALGKTQSKLGFTSRNSSPDISPEKVQKSAFSSKTGLNAELSGVTRHKVDHLRYARFRNGSGYIKTG